MIIAERSRLKTKSNKMWLDRLLNRKAINIRHDIVHRNGKDKDGNYHHFNKPMAEELAAKVITFADNIETQLAALDLAAKAQDTLPWEETEEKKEK